MRTELPVSQILKPIRTSHDIQLSVAIQIVGDHLLAIMNIGDHMLGPRLFGVIRDVEELRRILAVVISAYHRRAAAWQQRSNRDPMRPVAVPGANHMLFP